MGKFLSEMKPPHGAVKKRKRLGRGDASGHGGTSTKGHKGQKSRSGGYHKVGFEGGQMPLQRRLPKIGFTNAMFRKKFAVINLKDLEGIPAGTTVDIAYLKEKNRVRKLGDGLKVLGDGEIKAALTIVAHQFSKSAKEKIEKAGGKAQFVTKSSEKWVRSKE